MAHLVMITSGDENVSVWPVIKSRLATWQHARAVSLKPLVYLTSHGRGYVYRPLKAPGRGGKEASRRRRVNSVQLLQL